MVQKVNIDSALQLVKEYSIKYRNPGCSKLMISKKYYLYPSDLIVEEGCLKWPQKWEFCGEGGVYLILDKFDNVIYIGQTIHFGKRLGSYFRNNNKTCELKNSWKISPYSIVQIKIPSETIFERLSLEEFLIKNISPNENIRFKYQ